MASSKRCLRCSRAGLLACSVILLIIGDVMLGTGVYFLLFDGQPVVQDLNRAMPTEFLVLRIALVVTGSVIVLVNFCACAGVLLNSRCTLVLYSTLTSLIILACSIVAITMVATSKINDTIQSEVVIRLRSSYGNVTLITHAVDSVQNSLKCCGWQLVTHGDGGSNSVCDWFVGTAWWQQNRGGNGTAAKVCPRSCCQQGATAVATSAAACTKEAAYKQSCTPILGKYLLSIPILLVSTIFVSFLHLTCAIVLLSRSKIQISAV